MPGHRFPQRVSREPLGQASIVGGPVALYEPPFLATSLCGGTLILLLFVLMLPPIVRAA
jgi:hypothetical protein